jgi:hypothetical protein
MFRGQGREHGKPTTTADRSALGSARQGRDGLSPALSKKLKDQPSQSAAIRDLVRRKAW